MPAPALFVGVYKMAGNTRGKLKEHLEGIHRNSEWVVEHCEQCIILIAGDNPKVTEAFRSIAQAQLQLDELVLGVYSTI